MDYRDGALAFRHACRMGLEGIVSKRREPRNLRGDDEARG
jgi:ATP-dependent DNA ligase